MYLDFYLKIGNRIWPVKKKKKKEKSEVVLVVLMIACIIIILLLLLKVSSCLVFFFFSFSFSPCLLSSLAAIIAVTCIAFLSRSRKWMNRRNNNRLIMTGVHFLFSLCLIIPWPFGLAGSFSPSLFLSHLLNLHAYLYCSLSRVYFTLYIDSNESACLGPLFFTFCFLLSYFYIPRPSP